MKSMASRRRSFAVNLICNALKFHSINSLNKYFFSVKFKKSEIFVQYCDTTHTEHGINNGVSGVSQAKLIHVQIDFSHNHEWDRQICFVF